MVEKLHIGMMPTTVWIKIANFAFDKSGGRLRDIAIQAGDLVVPLEFLVTENSPYDIIIGLPTMIKLRARPDYYRKALKYISKANPKYLIMTMSEKCDTLLSTSSTQMTL